MLLLIIKFSCFLVQQTLVKCVSDSECADDRGCINGRCQDPCAEANPCGGHATCSVRRHRPICQCPPNWGGDPQIQCYQRKYNIGTFFGTY